MRGAVSDRRSPRLKQRNQAEQDMPIGQPYVFWWAAGAAVRALRRARLLDGARPCKALRREVASLRVV